MHAEALILRSFVHFPRVSRCLKLPDNRTVKLRKHKVIAQAYGHRRKKGRRGRSRHISFSYQSSHDDPLGMMTFSLNLCDAWNGTSLFSIFQLSLNLEDSMYFVHSRTMFFLLHQVHTAIDLSNICAPFCRYATRFQQQHISERYVVALGSGAATPHEAPSRDGTSAPVPQQ